MSGQIYTALPSAKSIRLLKLQPGCDNDPVICRLEVVSLDTAPTYEALSYV
jgi:hypothetical protein